MEASVRIFCYIILCRTFVLGQYVESESTSAISFSTPKSAEEGLTTSKFALVPNRPEEQWVCEPSAKHCIYIASSPKTWLDASERCITLGGRLPFWMGFGDTPLFTDEAKATSWSSLYWYAGRWHEYKAQHNTSHEFNNYLPAYLDHLVASDAVLRHIANGEHCFAIGLKGSDVRKGISTPASPFQVLGHRCNSTLPFLCITGQMKHNETQRKLKLSLKQITKIDFQKTTGPDQATEVLRCVPTFQYAYDNLKDRPFNIVWILDDAYYPKEGTKQGDHSTTITVPYKHFTKYACEVRYLGSIYGNRSQEIEVATPSRGKLGLIIRIRNATFPTSSLDYARPIKELVEAINNDPGVFNLSQVGDSMFEQKDSELFIAAYMLSNTFWRRDLTDSMKYGKQIESLNAFLNGSFVKQDLPFQANTVKAIEYFADRIRKGTLVGAQFVAVDRCPLERSESLFWIGGVGTKVLPNLMSAVPSENCSDKYDFPVSRTCSGLLVSGAQWVEPFSEGRNCSSEKSTPTVCPEGYSLTIRARQGQGFFCAKQVPSRSWNDAMEACFGGDIFGISEFAEKRMYGHNRWIHNTIDYLKGSNTSVSLMGSLIWLPSRRRVPGGPLYPYMMPPGFSGRYYYSSVNAWEGSLPDFFNSASISLSYGDLDPSKQCLAWSMKAQTLTTLSCAERHPTICIVDRGPAVDLRYVPQSVERVSSFYIPECRRFDKIVVNALGLKSCHKLINSSELARFTWEEARMQCKSSHDRATLAIPNSYSLSENTKSQLRNDNIDTIRYPTWFGVRQSRGRSNTMCMSRLVTSADQCADPIHYFSNDTDFLHGVYVSSSGNGRDSLTLRLPGSKVSHAMCQVNFQLALLAETPVTYHLKLALKNSTGSTLKLYLTREGSLLPGYDWEEILKNDFEYIRLGLVCFGDGALFAMPVVVDNETMEMFLEFPSNVTSFYCESKTSTELFLRSNTVLWRQARLTFVATVRDRRVRIVSETKFPSLENLQANARVAPSRPVIDSANVSRITISQFAEMFEPSKISNEHLRYNGSVDIDLGSDNYPAKIRKYTVLNTKYDRVVVESMNYEELLVRFHVVVNSTAGNLEIAFNQLGDDMDSLMGNMGRPSYDLEALRSMVTCLQEVEEREFGNLTWFETPLDRTTFSREGCVFEGGSLVQRTCIGDIYYGAYWGPTQAWNAEGRLVNLSNESKCASPTETTSRLLNITETRQNAKSALAELQRVTSKWDPIIADVQLSASIFSNASREETEFSQTNVEQTASIIQQVLNVNTDTLANAQRLPNVSTNLLLGIEEILTSTNADKSTVMVSTQHRFRGNTAEFTGPSAFLFTANSSNLGNSDDNVKNTRIIRSKSPDVSDYLHHDALVIFNGSSLMVNRINASQIAFVYQTNIRLADAAVAARETYAKVYSPNPSDGDRDMLRTANHTANSAMVQVAVGGGPVYNLSEPVQIYFRPFRAVNRCNTSNSVVCVFWKPEVNNSHGGWSTEGCSYHGNVTGLDHCQCNHLSSFTSFFTYDDTKPSSHEPILDVLTKIGCWLSIFGCISVIATYTLFPKWREPRKGYYGHHVIVQLSMALALLLSTFLGGFDRTANGTTDNGCLLVAVFLHYLILVVFFWMLVEAYCHYLLFVRVMGSVTSHFMLKFSLFAWLLPLVPVIALVVCDRELSYTSHEKKICWLKPRGIYIAVLPFVSLISLINLALYIIIIVKVGCAKSTIRSTQSKRSFTFYTAIVIFFVLGLSWIFGLLAIGPVRTPLSYLFCIFNSLQGFAIFFHFILRGVKAQGLWQNFMKRKRDRGNDGDITLGIAKYFKPTSTTTAGAANTADVSRSTSTSSIHSRIICELKNRQRLQKHSENETPNL